MSLLVAGSQQHSLFFPATLRPLRAREGRDRRDLIRRRGECQGANPVGVSGFGDRRHGS